MICGLTFWRSSLIRTGVAVILDSGMAVPTIIMTSSSPTMPATMIINIQSLMIYEIKLLSYYRSESALCCVYHFVWGWIAENVIDPPLFSQDHCKAQSISNSK